VGGVLAELEVGPFADGGLDEAFGFAVGAGRADAGADRPDTEAADPLGGRLLAELVSRVKILFATRYHWRSARSGEPARPPVPIARNAKERRTDHNSNEGRVNQHGDRQRKSDHLDHQEISEGECRKYDDHDRGGARN
jgi:hypothetical protein